MQKIKEFQKAIKETAQEFSKIHKKEIIRIISHLDADGICSSSILIDLLNKQKRKYNISILPQLNEENIKTFENESTNVFVFTDLGSGQLGIIQKVLKNKKIFVLDHHIPQKTKTAKNVHHLNPCNYDLDGSQEISGSGVVYLFVKELTKDTSMSHIAVIGAIGDTQEKMGFKGLNEEILKDATETGRMKITKGLRFFGLQTRPVYKLLQYSTDLPIPGITGSELNSLKFLKELDIKPKIGTKWRKLNDLSEKEKKKLVEGIIKKREDLENPEDIFAPVYLLPQEELSSPFRDGKEFSTLLNACGRMGKASIGIGACLGVNYMKGLAIKALLSYKREIVYALNWLDDSKENSEYVTKKKKYTLINAQNKIPATIIGTVTSILSKGKTYPEGHYILGLAQNNDLTTKISLRMAGTKNGTNLQNIIGQILSEINHGEGGGHVHAAGALIKTEMEEEFLKAAEEVLDRVVVEEKID